MTLRGASRLAATIAALSIAQADPITGGQGYEYKPRTPSGKVRKNKKQKAARKATRKNRK